MGIKCGVDIIEIDRIMDSINEKNGAFRDRVFTCREIQYCEQKKTVKYQSYAARFAAKEAVSKAFGTGIGLGISLKDIEILNDNMGRPYVVLHKKAEEVFKKLRGIEISLSLSHCKEYAVAYAVLEVSE